jgi:hypothetical protein
MKKNTDRNTRSPSTRTRSPTLSSKDPDEPKKTDSVLPNDSTLVEVAKGLGKRPELLFVFGMAMVLLAVGTITLDNLRLILGSLLALTVVGFVMWMIVETRNYHQRKRNTLRTPVSTVQIDIAKIIHSKVRGGLSDGREVHGKVSINQAKIKDSDIAGVEYRKSNRRR